MKVLIAGVSGFIGQELYSVLSKKHDVYGVSFPAINLPNCTELNFFDKESLAIFFEQNKFDVIINLVAIMANVKTAKDYGLFIKNLQIQENIIEGSKYFGETQFINFSSSAVYPNVNGEFSEKDIINPSANSDCLYGLAKFNSEMLFKFLFPETVKLLNLRIGFVYGTGMDKTRIHKVFEQELLEKNTITVFGNGERIISQLSVNSLISKIELSIAKKLTGTYNLADENISLKQLAIRIIKEKGNSDSKILYELRGNKTTFSIDCSEFKNIGNV